MEASIPAPSRKTIESWIVYLVAFGQAVVSQVLYPARNDLVPLAVSPADLVSVKSLLSPDRSAAPLAGPAIGGRQPGKGRPPPSFP